MDSCESLCFMVATSQGEESQVIDDRVKMLQKLPALNQTGSKKRQKAKTQQGISLSPGSSKMKRVVGLRSVMRQQAGSSDEKEKPADQQPPAGQQPGRSEAGALGGNGGDGGGVDQGGGTGAGGTGGGGGGGGDRGNHDTDDESDSEEHEEEAVEETPPSSGNSSTGLVPPLVRPSASAVTPPSQIPSPFVSHHQLQEERSDTGVHPGDPSSYQDPSPAGRREESPSESEGGGGISEASTAVVSDTEGHGQVIQRRSDVQPPMWPLPGCSHMSPSPRGGDVSSALSALSSLTSSSSSSQSQGTPRTFKKRPTRRKPQPDPKRRKLNTSSSTETKTSSSDTSREKSHNTSHDTSTSGDQSHGGSQSRETSHDTTGGHQPDPGDNPDDDPDDGPGDCPDKEQNSSQQDMFGDLQDLKQQPAKEDVLVSTPSDYIGSLQFSGRITSPVTAEHIQSLGYVPASQETLGSVPYLIASSPTAGVSEDEYGSERFRSEVSGVRKIKARKKMLDDEQEEDRQKMPPPLENPPVLDIPSRGRPISQWQPVPSLSLPETSQSLEEDARSLKGQKVTSLKTESQGWGLQLSATEQSEFEEYGEPQQGSVRTSAAVVGPDEEKAEAIKEECDVYGGRVVGELVMMKEPVQGLLPGEDTVEDDEDNFLDTTQGLALHLSPTQSTQSQFSCGVSSILKKLDSTQDVGGNIFPDEISEPLDEKALLSAGTSGKRTPGGSQLSKSVRPSRSQLAAPSQIEMPAFSLSIPGDALILRPVDMEDPSAAVASYLQEEEEAEKRAALRTHSENRRHLHEFTDTKNRLPETPVRVPALTLDMIESQEELTEPSLSLFRHDQPPLQEQGSDESQSIGSSVFRRVREVREKRNKVKELEPKESAEELFDSVKSVTAKRRQPGLQDFGPKSRKKQSKKLGRKIVTSDPDSGGTVDREGNRKTMSFDPDSGVTVDRDGNRKTVTSDPDSGVTVDQDGNRKTVTSDPDSGVTVDRDGNRKTVTSDPDSVGSPGVHGDRGTLTSDPESRGSDICQAGAERKKRLPPSEEPIIKLRPQMTLDGEEATQEDGYTHLRQVDDQGGAEVTQNKDMDLAGTPGQPNGVKNFEGLSSQPDGVGQDLPDQPYRPDICLPDQPNRPDICQRFSGRDEVADVSRKTVRVRSKSRKTPKRGGSSQRTRGSVKSDRVNTDPVKNDVEGGADILAMDQISHNPALKKTELPKTCRGQIETIPQQQTPERRQDPFEYRMSQSQHDQEALREVLELPQRTWQEKHKKEGQLDRPVGVESAPVVTALAALVPEDLHSLPSRRQSPATRRRPTPRKRVAEPSQKKSAGRKTTVTDNFQPERTEVVKEQATKVPVASPSMMTITPETETRTFQTIRIKTVFSQTLTIVQERIGSATINVTVQKEKLETLSRTVEHEEDSIETPSPSRTGQSMTSGDLADISSMSRSTGSKVSIGSTPVSLNSSSAIAGQFGKTTSTSNSSHPHMPNTSGHGTKTSCLSVSTGEQTAKTVLEGPSPVQKSSDPAQSASLLTTNNTQILESKETTPKNRLASSEGSFIKPVDLQYPDKSLKRNSKSTSTSNLQTSTSLFSTSLESLAAEKQAVLGRRSSSTSLQQSASLFSTSTSPEVLPAGAVQDRETTGLPPQAAEKDTMKKKSLSSAQECILKEKNMQPTSNKKLQEELDQPTPQTDEIVNQKCTEQGSMESDVAQSLIPATPQTEPVQRSRGRRGICESRGQSVSSRTLKMRGVSEETQPVVAKGTGSGRGRVRGARRIQRQPMNSDRTKSSPDFCLRGSRISSSLSGENTSQAVIERGVPVFALWKDRFFYPGHVVVYESQGKYTISFADGDIRQVRESDLVLRDDLHVGYPVMAERPELGGWSEVAFVTAIENEDTDLVYQVQFDDGITKKVPLKNLSLKYEQVKFMRKQASLVSEASPKTESFTGAGKVKQQLQPRDKAVYAMCNDRFFYPGYLVTHEGDNKFTIAFEDGDVRPARDTDILHCHLLAVGQAVFAERKDWNEVAKVVEVLDKPSEDWGYVVEFDDGTQKRLSRGKVILSYDQATALKRRTALLSLAPGIKVADVSLDNLMPGKRRRCTSQQAPNTSLATGGLTPETPISSTTPSRSVRNTTGKIGRKLALSTGAKRKRKLSDLEPKATSTPTPKPKRKEQGKAQPDVAEAPSPLPNVSFSPQMVKKSPRRVKQALFSTVKGQIPSRGSKLFQGLGFLLTHVERTQEQKEEMRKLAKEGGCSSNLKSDEIRKLANEGGCSSNLKSDEIRKLPTEGGCSSDLTSDESILGPDGDEVPFDKDHLEAQVRAGGGMVLEKFDQKLVKNLQQCLCVSDTFQRTLKYFQCLAAGFTCISHVWIRDSCQMGQLQDYNSYRLPAGISIEQNKIIEPKLRGNGLHGLMVVVETKNSRFQETWSQVLETAGCHVTNRLPDDTTFIDVVVTDKDIAWDVLQRALEADLPVVSSEWVIQSLITGRRVPYRSHPKYVHDYDDGRTTSPRK